MEMNRIWNSRNLHQGNWKKVLCVCSAGLLRSPTLARVLSMPPYNYNTRSAGLEKSYALIPVDKVLLAWADEVFCMNEFQREKLMEMTETPVFSLEITDSYSYMDPDLIETIEEKLKKHYA